MLLVSAVGGAGGTLGYHRAIGNEESPEVVDSMKTVKSHADEIKQLEIDNREWRIRLSGIETDLHDIKVSLDNLRRIDP